MSIVSERLNSIRQDRGLSRNEAATLLDVPANTLRNYENGSREPGHIFIIKAAKLYHVTSDYILGMDSVDPRRTIADFSLAVFIFQSPSKPRSCFKSCVSCNFKSIILPRCAIVNRF